MELYEYVLLSAVTGLMVAMTFWTARRLSSRIEERAERIRELRKQLDNSEMKLAEKDAVIDGKQREIEQLKLMLTEKDKKIVELEERMKFAEKVSERDLEKIKDRISAIHSEMQELASHITEERGKKK